MTVPFSREDLADTAQRIKDRLDGDNETLALLQELLDQVQGNNEQWQDQLSELQQGQSDIAKAIVMLARQNSGVNKRLDSITKGVAAVFRMSKAQTVSTGKPLTKSLLGKTIPAAQRDNGGMTLDGAERLGTLAKTIRGVFGSNGGHSMVYNAPLASKMILEGTLAAKQHQVWKRSNRLHNDPYQALQRRKVG